jgi:hypothetical protein
MILDPSLVKLCKIVKKLIATPGIEPTPKNRISQIYIHYRALRKNTLFSALYLSVRPTVDDSTPQATDLVLSWLNR